MNEIYKQPEKNDHRWWVACKHWGKADVCRNAFPDENAKSFINGIPTIYLKEELEPEQAVDMASTLNSLVAELAAELGEFEGDVSIDFPTDEKDE